MIDWLQASPFWVRRGLHHRPDPWRLLHNAGHFIHSKTKDYEKGSNKKLPHRLIDLGNAGWQDRAQSCRLVEPKEGSHGIYIALSHRWSLKRYVTTKNNIAMHRQQILLEDLPKTFQDAIFLCQFFKVRYLWIDSLCIVQDDGAEWMKESRLMSDIYHNALCTIAVHSLQKGDDGFLLKTFETPMSVSLRGSNRQEWIAFLPSLFSRDIIYHSSISSRGWVLQERLLSEHVLHFLPSHIYWESDDTIIDVDTGKTDYLDNTPRMLSEWRSKQSWIEVVEWYSKCRLTENKDKLTALAGIATTIQRIVHDHYIAGMWRQAFKEQLLWVASNPKSTIRRKPLVASSLSWASIDGPVTFIIEPDQEAMGRRQNYLLVHGFDLEGPAIDCFPQPNKDDCNANLIWMDQYVPLQFLGLPTELPNLGRDSRQWLLREDAGYVERTISFEFPRLHSALYRTVTIGNDVIGCVFLDEESDHVSQCKLWFFLLGETKETYLALVVVRDDIGRQEYRRIGLGIFSLLIERHDTCELEYLENTMCGFERPRISGKPHLVTIL